MSGRAALLLYLTVATAICFGWIASTDIYVMEGIVADGAREMVRSGEYAVPRLHGEIYMYKPPLAYWLAAIPLQIWERETEFTLRAPFALCTVLLGLAVLWLSRRTLGPRRALICALAAITGGLMVQKLHRAEFDMPLALGIGVAILAACGNLAADRSSRRLWALCYLGLSIGFLAKGGPALMLFGPGLLLAAIATGRVRALLRPAHLAAVALFLLVVAGWVHGVFAAEGWQAFDQPLVEARDKGFSEWTWSTFGVALTKPLLVVGLFVPWSILLPIVLRRSWWRSLAPPERRLALGAAAFVVTGAVAFTVVPTTESRYFLPLSAPVGVLFGMAAYGHDRKDRAWRIVDRVVLVVSCGLGLAAIAVAVGPWASGLPIRAAAVVLAAATVALVLSHRRRPSASGRAALLLAAALGHWLVHTAVLEPARVEKRSLRSVAAAFRPHLAPGETLWTTPVRKGFHHSGLIFYLGHPVRTVTREAMPVRGSALVLFSDEPRLPGYVLPVEHTVIERQRRRGVEFVLARATGGAATAPEALAPAGIRAILRRAADWQLAHPRHPPRDWTNAVLSAGLLAAYRSVGEERYLDELLRVGEEQRWRPGERDRHADDHAIAQTYLDLSRITGEGRMIRPFREVADRMMSSPPSWREEHQTIDYWWSDALFMSPPALAKLARVTGDRRYLEFMGRLWRQAHALLYDPQERLFHRDSRKIGDGAFWSRGNAWVLAGIVRVLEELPADDADRELYVSVYRQMAERVATLQGEDGLWRADLLASPLAAPGETSGTALFCYALAWGVRHEILDRERYLPIVMKAWSALYRSVDERGRLGWVQAPGVGPANVRASHWEVYGTGAFLLAGEEVLALVGSAGADPPGAVGPPDPMLDRDHKAPAAATGDDHRPAGQASPPPARARFRGLAAAAAVAAVAAPLPATGDLQVKEQVAVAPVWSGHPVGFAIETAGGRQYVAFYDEDRWMTVAARDLGSPEWTFKKLRSQLAWDSHSEVVLATDSRGFVHVAGNMHGDPLVYFRSQRPHDISTLERSAMIGAEERRVTYPRFVRDSRGALFFHYRDGKSGRGVRIFNRWDPQRLAWNRYLDRPLFDGQGRVSAYLTGPLPGPDGRFHLVWVWRDTPSGATNHDISYARSADLADWETAGGEPLELPITPADSAAIVDPVKAGGGLAGIAFHVGWDGDGRPVVNYVKYGPRGASQLHNARWEDGRWRIYQTTDWSWRWELDITGSLPHSIVTEAVRVDDQGRLRQRFRHLEAGTGDWLLEPATLRPIETLPTPETLARLRQPESPAPGMEVRQLTWDREGEYLLRWETLPHNRDRRRAGPVPEPTMLEVLRLGEGDQVPAPSRDGDR